MADLVTGYRGFIGGHVYKALGEAVGIDINDKAPFDVRTVVLNEKYDTIYHLAADASIPRSFENPVFSHSVNVVGTLRMLELARKTGAKLVFSSSSSAYDLKSPYSLEKYICEQYMDFYWKTWGVKSVALRYFNVFGEGQERANGGYSLALSKFLDQKKRKQPFTIVGTGEQRRDFVYVGDVAQANLKASAWLDTATEFKAFDVGTGKNYSVNEVCDMIDPKNNRTYLPPRIEPMIGLANKDKFVPGWEPLTSLEKWLT